jgi:hypothetical protein
MNTEQDRNVHNAGYRLLANAVKRRTPSDPSPLSKFLTYTCLPNNLSVIRKECGETKRKTSNALRYGISVVFPEHLSGLRNKTTSHTALRYILLQELNTENFPSDEAVTVISMMRYVSKIIKAHYHSKPMTERQAYSDIRTRVLKVNFGDEWVAKLKSSKCFCQSDENKALANELQTGARDGRIMKQTDIDFTAAVDVGRTLVNSARSVMDDYTTLYSEERINTLLATVMYSTGCRLIEVLLVSDFIYDIDPNTSITRPGASHVCISPVAKLRDYSADKFSSRVVLFGLTTDDIIDMVARIRNYLRAINPVYEKLNKAVAGDRRYVVRMLPGYTRYVPSLLSRLSDDHTFTPRDFRGLYVSLSYELWAKHPTSEIMWINKTLSHGSVDTSLSYNKFRLVETSTNTNHRYEKRLREIENTLSKIKAFHNESRGSALTSKEAERSMEGQCFGDQEGEAESKE